MNLHERQQFDHLLHEAVDRFAERLEQRNAGAATARQRLQDEPEGDGIWLGSFVDAVFRDFLLDNTAGACFVLAALERRRPQPMAGASTIGETLQQHARAAFAALLREKTDEELARRAGYQAVDTTAG